jgi:hypothetical protein
MPLQVAVAQTAQKVKPQNQADALRESTDNMMYEKKLSPTASAMKADVILLRDSIDVAAGYAMRLASAVSMNSPSVALSAAKALRPACAIASRTFATTRPRFAALRIQAADRTLQGRTDKILGEYRTAALTLDNTMKRCDRELGSTKLDKSADLVRLRALGEEISAGVIEYEAILRNTLNALDIPLRPKQQGRAG